MHIIMLKGLIMKKTLLIIGITVMLFVSMSSATATSFKTHESKTYTKQIEKTDADQVPDWAVGNFTGQWGLNIWGHDLWAIGQLSGHYGTGFLWDLKIGRFLIDYKENGHENGTTLEGLFFGSYMLGKATDQETGNASHFVGLGQYNETGFRWRIMGMTGPTLYMQGTFSKFE